MPVSIDGATGAVSVRDNDDRRVWDTMFPPVNWMPENAWVELDDFNINFPDFEKGCWYGYDFGSNIPTNCITTCVIKPQSWTSGWSTIGTVPQGCNVIDVRGTVVRTKAPHNVLGLAVSNGLHNQETAFVGGWCLVESEFSFARTFEFRLSGSNIQFRRSQSTRQAQAGENPSVGTDSAGRGWTLFGGSGTANGALVGVIDEKTYNPSKGPVYPGGADACSTNTSSFDFSSRYRGTVVIRPGYIRP